jgi:hypothetical protein
VPVLFRSFVCQIFIERFGVTVNEWERARRPAGKKEEKRREKGRKKNQEHEWGGAATIEAIAEVFGDRRLYREIIGDFETVARQSATNAIRARVVNCQRAIEFVCGFF